MRPVGDHFYTTSSDEQNNAIASFGYVDEGIACWVLPAVATTTQEVLLYRLYSANTGDHFYTTSASERDEAILKAGYQDEGVAWGRPRRSRRRADTALSSVPLRQ